MYNGITNSMVTLHRLSNAKTRSVCPEHFTGEKGRGGMAEEGTASRTARGLGQGWKLNPYVVIQAGETFPMCDLEGPGAIQHIWLTASLTPCWRQLILRIYWDDQPHPSVECPLGDFFASGYQEFAQLSSLAVCNNPGSGFNCYWTMPFRSRCRMTLQNATEERMSLYYQIDYALGEVEEDAAYFHAQFRRENPTAKKVPYTVLNTVRGKGQLAGLYMLWAPKSDGWWGEGELKFYLDGDTEFPTICGTGTEDYFGGAYDYVNQQTRQYQTYSTPYSGLHQIVRPDGLYRSQLRFGMYRWHITDPIRFDSDLRITCQALGWQGKGEDARYRLLQDDISSVAFWYQTLPSQPLEPLPPLDELPII